MDCRLRHYHSFWCLEWTGNCPPIPSDNIAWLLILMRAVKSYELSPAVAQRTVSLPRFVTKINKQVASKSEKGVVIDVLRALIVSLASLVIHYQANTLPMLPIPA